MTTHWFKFQRDLWNDKIILADTDHLAVWCFLASYAAFEPYTGVFRGEVLEIERGQLVTSVEIIALHTTVERSKVRRILRRFEIAQYITQTVSNKGRLITLHQPAQKKAPPATKPSGKKPKSQVFSSDASYDLEAYRQTAIGMGDD